MEKDILSAIVDVEEEIQERLVAEQRRAGAELCELAQELAKKASQQEELLAAAMEQAVAAARIEAQKRATAIVHHAEMRAEQLAGLSDGALEQFVMRHLDRILPGDDQ